MPTQETRYFFGKHEKLKSRKAIESLFSKGQRFSNFPFKIVWLPENKDAVLQAGIGVSSRHFKKATDRNRIKRLIREAYRLQKKILEDYLLEKNERLSVFILYIGNEIPDYDFIYKKTGTVIKRLIHFYDENNQKPA